MTNNAVVMSFKNKFKQFGKHANIIVSSYSSLLGFGGFSLMCASDVLPE